MGAISVLSGEGPAWGVNHQRGSLLAVDEINAAGGVAGKQVRVIFEDSPSGLARGAVTAYRKLTAVDKVRFILGPLTMDESSALLPLAEKDGVFLMGATYFPRVSTNSFSTWIDADIESDRLATHLRTRFARIAILASEQSWEAHTARRIRATFIRLGGQVDVLEEPSFETASVKNEALKVLRGNSDAVVITSYFLFAKYVRELKALKVTVPLFGIELDQSVVDSTGGLAEGVRYIAPSPPKREFVAKFRRRFEADPDIPAASSYDAVHVLCNAIRDHGSDVAQVSAALNRLREYNGAARMEVRDGKVVVGTSLYEVRDGRIRYLDDIEVSSL